MDCPRCGEFNSSLAAQCSSCKKRLSRKAHKARAQPDEREDEAPEGTGRTPPVVVPEKEPPALGSPGRLWAPAALYAAGLLLDAARDALLLVLFARDRVPAAARAEVEGLGALLIALGNVSNWLASLFFLRWLYAIWRDVARLGVSKPGYTPGRSVALFFVPFVNLVHPFKVFRSLNRATDPEQLPPADGWVDDPQAGYRDAAGAELVVPSPPQVMVGLWFGFNIYNGFVHGLLFSVATPASRLFLLLSQAALSTLSITLMTGFDARLRELHRRLRSLALGKPALPEETLPGLVRRSVRFNAGAALLLGAWIAWMAGQGWLAAPLAALVAGLLVLDHFRLSRLRLRLRLGVCAACLLVVPLLGAAAMNQRLAALEGK